MACSKKKRGLKVLCLKIMINKLPALGCSSAVQLSAREGPCPVEAARHPALPWMSGAHPLTDDDFKCLFRFSVSLVN